MFPGAQAWRNPEHLDQVDAARKVSELPPLALGEIPLRAITASDGDDADQSALLELSSDAQQTTLSGGHDLAEENTQGVVAEIKKLLDVIED